MIKLAEPLFVSFQGEGKNQGRMALFIRFTGCNLTCKICDTKYSWKDGLDKEEDEIFETIDFFITKEINLIVLTGGEPLFQNEKFILNLVSKYSSIDFDIETNGTIPVMKELLKLKNINFVISPKTNIQQINEVKGNTVPLLLVQLIKNEKDNFIIKFLFSSKQDLEDILKLKNALGFSVSKIWVQPIGIEKEDLLNKIKDNYLFILQNRFNISFRLHCLLFGNKKGV